MGNSLNQSLDALFSKLEGFVSTKTVVGEPVTVGDIILLPLVDISFGVGAGAFDSNDVKGDKKSENGGGGLGASITPSAVLVINNGTVQLVNIKNQDSVNKIIDLVPGLVSKLNLGSLFNKEKSAEE